MNKYTTEEIALHDNLQDLWIIIHGNVYDVTSFHQEHPGGEEVLLGLAGKDATECFDDIGHSDEAKKLREKFKVGEVMNQQSAAQSQIKSEVQSKTTSADMITDVTEPAVNDHNRQKQMTGNTSLVIMIYVIVAIYAIIYFYQNM